MTISDIVDFLEDNGIAEVEEIENEDQIVVKFFYDFDNDELEAAKSYANEESDLEENSDEWYKDWYLSYLSDVANDNVEEIVEELCEELELVGYFKQVEMDNNSAKFVKYMAVFAEDFGEADLEEVLNDYL